MSRLPVRRKGSEVSIRGLARDARLLLALAGLWAAFYVLVAVFGGGGFDSHAYWLTRGGIDYGLAPGQRDAYLYSPVFAQAIRPLTLLPWRAFALLWFAAAGGTYVWLTRGVAARWRPVLLALCLGDVVYGNVWWLFALVLCFGLRRPTLWAVPLLLKITPAVGLVWFAARREWRNLATVFLVATGVVLISYPLDPSAWTAWLDFLLHRRERSDLDVARLCAAAGLTVFAARTNRAHLLPAALWLAAPVFSINGLAICAALPRLLELRRAPAHAVSGSSSLALAPRAR
jgi:hypothetical protein